MKPVRGIRCAFQGLAGAYLSALVEQWLLVAPRANPAMLEMFRDRDSPPLRDLVPWDGEFAGKYLTGAAQVLAATGDARLRAHLAEFVAELVASRRTTGTSGRGRRFPSARNAPNSRDGKDLWDAWGHYHVMLGLMLWSDRSADPRASRRLPASATSCAGPSSARMRRGSSTRARRR